MRTGLRLPPFSLPRRRPNLARRRPCPGRRRVVAAAAPPACANGKKRGPRRAARAVRVCFRLVGLRPRLLLVGWRGRSLRRSLRRCRRLDRWRVFCRPVGGRGVRRTRLFVAGRFGLLGGVAVRLGSSLALIAAVLLVFVQFRVEDKRVGQVGAQRDQVGAHPPREAQVQMQRIVDRVELAETEKVEVVAVRVEGRRDVAQQRARHHHGVRGPLRVALLRAGFFGAVCFRAVCFRAGSFRAVCFGAVCFRAGLLRAVPVRAFAANRVVIRRQTEELDRGRLRRERAAVRQPAAVGRPVERAHGPVQAAVDKGHARCLRPIAPGFAHVHQQQLAAVVRKRDDVLGGRDLKRNWPTQLEPVDDEGRRPRLARIDLQPFLARFVADHQEALPVIQPLGQPVAHPRAFAVLHDRPVVGVEREGLAARRNRQGAPAGVQARVVQKARGIDKAPVALHTRPAELDIHALRLLAQRVKHKQVGPGVVDDALPVAAGVADVELFAVGVAAHVAAVRPAGVEIAHALVVAGKVDALVAADCQPHGRRHVAAQPLHEALELAAAVRVDPELACRAAPVPFPVGRLPRKAAQDDLAVGAKGNRPGGAVRQRRHLAAAAACRHTVQRKLACKRLPRIARKDNLRPIGRPAQHARVAAQVGKAARATAAGVHDMDFRGAFVGADVGHLCAVGRKGGVERGAVASWSAGAPCLPGAARSRGRPPSQRRWCLERWWGSGSSQPACCKSLRSTTRCPCPARSQRRSLCRRPASSRQCEAGRESVKYSIPGGPAQLNRPETPRWVLPVGSKMAACRRVRRVETSHVGRPPYHRLLPNGRPRLPSESAACRCCAAARAPVLRLPQSWRARRSSLSSVGLCSNGRSHFLLLFSS